MDGQQEVTVDREAVKERAVSSIKPGRGLGAQPQPKPETRRVFDTFEKDLQASSRSERLLSHLGGCRTYGPLLGPRNIRCRTILRTQKGTIILTPTHMDRRGCFQDAVAAKFSGAARGQT